MGDTVSHQDYLNAREHGVYLKVSKPQHFGLDSSRRAQAVCSGTGRVICDDTIGWVESQLKQIGIPINEFQYLSVREQAAYKVSKDHKLCARYPRISALAIRLKMASALDIAAGFGADSISEYINNDFINLLNKEAQK